MRHISKTFEIVELMSYATVICDICSITLLILYQWNNNTLTENVWYISMLKNGSALNNTFNNDTRIG